MGRTIRDKHTARSTVEQMRLEMQIHGSEILESNKINFLELTEKYEAARLAPAQYANGLKV